MAETIKPPSQSAPAAATLTDAYTVPASTTAVVSSVLIANRSSVPTSYRISIAIAGAGDTVAQYIAYDIPIDGNESFSWTVGGTLGAADVVRVYATLATLSFNIFKSEIT